MRIKSILRKAAMFGLDARIALAIFISLSIIVAVFLYSVFVKIQVVTTLSHIKEIEQAMEQYYLDTGKRLPKSKNFTYPETPISIDNLFEDPGFKGWRGPYLNSEAGATVRLGRVSASPTYPRVGCSDISHPNCAYWIEIYGVLYEVKKIIDKKIDGKDSPLSGRVRNCTIKSNHCGSRGSLIVRLDVP